MCLEYFSEEKERKKAIEPATALEAAKFDKFYIWIIYFMSLASFRESIYNRDTLL